MKLRKNIGSARVEAIRQLGYDRIADLQFGSGDFAKHLIVELFDQGNLILTDHEYCIIMILRSRKSAGITVGTKYDTSAYKQFADQLSSEKVEEIVNSAADKDQVKRLFNPYLPYGVTVFEHVLLKRQLPVTAGKIKLIENYVTLLMSLINDARELFCRIISQEGSTSFLVHSKNSSETETIYEDFIPYLFCQFESKKVTNTNSFNEAVDVFYSNVENEKLTKTAKNMEAAGRQKSEKIKADHQKRVELLKESQNTNFYKAVLIEENIDLVDSITGEILRGLSDGLSWDDINSFVDEYSSVYPLDHIKHIKFESNTVTLLLAEEDDEPVEIDIDMSITAYANARKYYQIKKELVQKEQKTINSTEKALESANNKAKKSFKNAGLIKTISKIRKPFWFEKFKWFISSDNLIVVAGGDQQQNELLVSRYLREGDVFVHADLSGAPVVVVKADKSSIPPRTLEEAGTMAVCLTSAWDSKMSIEAYWVHYNQVSKTPPSGEYLPTGSFMIRGKKNSIPPCRHIYGFGVLFKTAAVYEEGEKVEQNTVCENEQHVNQECDANFAQDDNGQTEQTEACDDVEDSFYEKQESIVSSDETDFHDENFGKVGEKEVCEDLASFDESQEVLGEEINKDEYFNEICEDGKNKDAEMDRMSEDNLWDKNDMEMTEFILSRRSITYEFKKVKLTQKNNEMSSNDDKINKNWSKAKKRKFMKKYGDQDEHDRVVNMAILGSCGEPKERKNKKQERQQKAAEARLYHQKRMEERLKKKAVEKVSEIELNEPIECESLRSLTACPTEGDEILYAIPVCAPYSAISNYKFKLKLLHGPAKRGKACRQALNILMNDKAASDVEKSLMKTLVDVDLSKSAPSCLKVVYKPSQFKKK